MKNRSRYIVQRNEYDLMMAIVKNTNVCPIYAVSGKPALCVVMTIRPRNIKICSKCVQKWLNEEEQR